MTTIGWQKIEGALVGLLAGGAAVTMGAGLQWPWWMMVIAVLAPDLSATGYLAGPRAGAAVYNLAHLYATGLALVVIGIGLPGMLGWAVTGLFFVAHAGIDRALGFGLKDPTGFKNTHLGRIGQ